MGVSGLPSTKDDAGHEGADHSTEDGAHPPLAPDPHQEPGDHGAPGDRSSFVTIGGGLIALGLLVSASGRPRNRRVRPFG
ncbi:MAG TPA: hypothetical protein VH482_07815 [Thermomicrobiales bacterium]|jgi:hypothetical protein